MHGLKSVSAATVTIASIELAQRIRKQQFRVGHAQSPPALNVEGLETGAVRNLIPPCQAKSLAAHQCPLPQQIS